MSNPVGGSLSSVNSLYRRSYSSAKRKLVGHLNCSNQEVGRQILLPLRPIVYLEKFSVIRVEYRRQLQKNI